VIGWLTGLQHDFSPHDCSNYKVSKVETWHASAVWYKDDAYLLLI